MRLRSGQRKTVNFNVPVGEDEIDRHQSLDYGDNCKVRATMVDTFGTPQG